MDIIRQLNELQEKFNLEKKALDGAIAWAGCDDLGISRSITGKFEYLFKLHKFCFKHADLPYCYIETTYDIEYKGECVGYYSLYTDLEGEPVDDALVITDEDLRHT